MRNVLHDWPLEKARLILQNQKEAMGKDSVILIDEAVVPNFGAHWRATQTDMAMMTMGAALERTESQWRELLDSVGLKVRKIYKYTEDQSDSVIVAVPK